jgi:hypothetical protein
MTMTGPFDRGTNRPEMEPPSCSDVTLTLTAQTSSAIAVKGKIAIFGSLLTSCCWVTFVPGTDTGRGAFWKKPSQEEEAVKMRTRHHHHHRHGHDVAAHLRQWLHRCNPYA